MLMFQAYFDIVYRFKATYHNPWGALTRAASSTRGRRPPCALDDGSARKTAKRINFRLMDPFVFMYDGNLTCEEGSNNKNPSWRSRGVGSEIREDAAGRIHGGTPPLRRPFAGAWVCHCIALPLPLSIMPLFIARAQRCPYGRVHATR